MRPKKEKKKYVCLPLPDRLLQKVPTLNFFSQESAKNYKKAFYHYL